MRHFLRQSFLRPDSQMKIVTSLCSFILFCIMQKTCHRYSGEVKIQHDKGHVILLQEI